MFLAGVAIIIIVIIVRFAQQQQKKVHSLSSHLSPPHTPPPKTRSEIAKRIPGRLSKRVRERWTCQLNPERKAKEVVPWTPEEVARLFEIK